MLTNVRKSIVLTLAFVMIATGILFVALSDVYASDATIDSVRTSIQALSAYPTDYNAADKQKVESIWADYQALSAEDQAAIDSETTGGDQPLGRILESALWSVWSYNTINNSTTLADGTYDAATTPALSSEYSKGKSTSSRSRPWSVKSVTVAGGKATATITVESDSYSGMWMGGKTYQKSNTSGNSVFVNVPVDLNSTFYFAGISTTMPRPIAFSLTTTITEPASTEPTPGDDSGGGGNDPAPDTQDDESVKNMTAAKEAIAAAKAALTDKVKVEAALAAISKLTEDQKAKITADIKVIEDAKKAIEEKEAEAEKEAADKAETERVEAVKSAMKSVKAGKRSFTVTWKKDPTMDGYQVSYKTGTNEKTINISKNTTVKKKVKKLKKGKKYTVRVRAYKIINDMPAFTKWSSAKTVKVK